MTDKEPRRGQARWLRLLAGLLVLALVWGTVPAVRVQAASKKTGWVKKSGKKYYYVKGKKVKGWKTIKGKTYFFNKKGVMQTNQIVGNSKGYHYVGKDGVRCLDPAIEAAKDLVRELTYDSMSNKQKLETVYHYLVDDCSYRADYYTFGPQSFGTMALRMAQREAGDCYEGALLMTYVGRVLGYTSRLAQGYVDSNLTNSQVSQLAYTDGNEHGWAEIMLGKQPYLVYDISMQRVYPPKLYGVSRAQYAYALKAIAVYRLNVKNGQVLWS